MKRKTSCFLLITLLFLILAASTCRAETIPIDEVLTFKAVDLNSGPVDHGWIGSCEWERYRFSRNLPIGRMDYEIYCGLNTSVYLHPNRTLVNLEYGGTTSWVYDNLTFNLESPSGSGGALSAEEIGSMVPADSFNFYYDWAEESSGYYEQTRTSSRDELVSRLQSFSHLLLELGHIGNQWYDFQVPRTPATRVARTTPINNFGNFTYKEGGKVVITKADLNSVNPASLTACTLASGTFSAAKPFPPLVNAPPRTIHVGERILGNGYADGVTGTWGHTKTNTIPALGSIMRMDILANAQDPYFSGTDATGTIHNIGIRSIPIQVKDSSGSPNPAADITNTTRVVTSTTDTAPTIRAEIPAGAVNAQGGSANASVPYSSTGNNPGGGVDGWTNFPVTVTCDASAITGDYLLASVWSPPDNGGNFPGTPLDRWLTITGAPGEAASASTVFKEPAAPGGGWFTSGWCADRANQVFLSPKVPPVELKYDPGAPAAGLSFHPETKTFSDTSSDGLSGINPLKTSILFCTVGGAAPGAANTGWQLLSNYNIPITATNYDVYVKAYDKAGNYDIRLANGNLKLHGSVEASIDTDKGAAVHAANCPNLTGPTKIDGSCTADCHDAAMLELTEGSTFSYIYTLHDTDAYVGTNGSFVNYLPSGVIPTGTALMNITSTSGKAMVSGTVAASAEILGVHIGQYKITGNYMLDKAAGGDSLTFEVECRVPQYDTVSETGNIFVNHEGTVDFAMDDGFMGTAGYGSAVHKVKPLPMHDLTLAKTVTGKYGNRDKMFTFRLDMEQPWGPKLNRTCNYSKTSGASGTMTIKNGAIEKIDSTQTDSISLKHGESIKIEGLPEGCRYRIAEEPHIGYTTTEKVDGADYSPAAVNSTDSKGNIESAAGTMGTSGINETRNSVEKDGVGGTNTIKDTAEKMADTLAGPISLKRGVCTTSGELPKDISHTTAVGSGVEDTKVRREAGAIYSDTAEGVVMGTVSTANVQVDYFNDKSTLAPPTGINIPGGGGILLMILAVSAVLGGGFFLWKKKSRRVFVGFLALAPILMAALPFTGSRAYAADAVPPLTVRQEIMVEDGTPPTERISYHMAAVTPGAPLPAGAAGDYPFAITGTGEYVLPDIAYSGPGEYLYEISPEAGAGIPGFTYDGTVFTVVEYVTAGTDGWDISRAIKDPEGYKCGGVGYRHSYRPQASDPSVMVDPPVRKRVDGSPDKAGSFRFSLTAEKETYPMPDGSRGGKKAMAITGPGEKDFGTWAYTHTGTYRYSIAEADAGEEGYTYDKTVYTITDVVTDQGGVLKVGRTAADGNGKPVTAFLFTNRYQKDSGGSSRPPVAKGGNGSSVLSGDAARPARWALMQAAAGISLLALGCAGRKRRRCKEERRPR